jgi:methanogenic corrinoid protein MtbC1
VAVFVGGPAIRSAELARSLGADGWARDAVGALELLAATDDGPSSAA